jgi:hypothetical protein
MSQLTVSHRRPDRVDAFSTAARQANRSSINAMGVLDEPTSTFEFLENYVRPLKKLRRSSESG